MPHARRRERLGTSLAADQIREELTARGIELEDTPRAPDGRSEA